MDNLYDLLEELRRSTPKELHELIYKISLGLPEEQKEKCQDDEQR